MQQNNNYTQFKNALAISRMDKMSLTKNKQQTNKQLQQTIVIQDGLKSTYFMCNNDLPQIDENTIEVSESNLLVTTRKIEQNLIPRMEGILLKKSPYLIQGWQQRWAVCSDNRLVYYLLEDRNTPFGIIDFNIMTYSLQEILDQHGNVIEFVLIPKGSSKNFIFKALNNTDTLRWLNTVKENQKLSEGAQKILNSMNRYPKFWKTNRISNKQFLKIGDTGDLLLFRGIGINCIIQRGLTGSDYDHSAVLLRFPSGQLYIFEATGYFGVGLCSWSDMIGNRWFELYEKIVVRRLEIDRDLQFLKTVQEFVNQNLGKTYLPSPMKQVGTRSSVEDINRQSNREERTFFCSEKVASLYKYLGIFDQKTPAALYSPGTLSSKNRELKVLKGKLLQEQLIDFSDI